MKRWVLVLLTAPLVGAALATVSVPVQAGDELVEVTLDGKSFPGRIRAAGLYGVIPVKGTLGFEDGELTWAARGAPPDRTAYTVTEVDGRLFFSAEVRFDDGGGVVWNGAYDGTTVRNVTAVWTRAKGDFVHDLLLPDRVTLVFTPR